MLWQKSDALLRILAQMGKNAGETRFSHLMLGSGLAGLLMACTAHVAVFLESASTAGLTASLAAGPAAGSATSPAAAFAPASPAAALAAAGVTALGIFFIWLLRLPFFPFSAITGSAAAWCRLIRPASLAYSWLVVLLGNSAGALLAVFMISGAGYQLQAYYPGASPVLSPAGLAYVMAAGSGLNLGFAAHFFRGLLFVIIIGWALVFYIHPPRLISRAGLFLGAAFLAAGGGFEQVVDIMFRIPLGLMIAAGQADLLSTAMYNGGRLFPLSSAELAAYFNSIPFVYGVFIPVLLGNICGGALLAMLLARMSGYRKNKEAV